MSNALSELRAQAKEVVDQLPRSAPTFDLHIQWSRSYDDLFARSGESTSEDEVLSRVLARGRCILTGRGGAGKTQLLYRTMRRALESGILPILINLKDWTSADYESWKDWTAQGIEFGAEFLLERFSQPRSDALRLDSLPPNTLKLVIVDGLNEIASQVGQKILLSLDELARDQIGMYVLVADRLTRRELPSSTRWALGTTLSIDADQIRKLLMVDAQSKGDKQGLLGIPYFLNVAIQDNEVRTSRSEAHAEFLTKHGGLTEEDLNTLAGIAFSAYKDTGSRTFPTSELKSANALAQKLLAAGILLPTASDDVQFSHHLIHDYLAARHVAQMSEKEWTASVLKTISFDGSSFDTVSMVFSFLQGDRADEFLRKVYDWNLYAAGYALSEGAAPGQGPSKEMQAVMLAMLAEKMFDILEPTSRMARDAMSLVDVPLAKTFAKCESIEQLLKAVASITSDVAWFNEWKSVFTLRSDETLADDSLHQLRSEDSVLGWTVANVAKRTKLTPEQQTFIRTLAGSTGTTAKWRIAHVLGALPSVENVELLKKLLVGDPDQYVQYGALRSLLEAAARASEESLRRLAIDAVMQNAGLISARPRLLGEAKRALFVRREGAPSTWGEIAQDVSRAFYERETSEEGRDYWRKFVGEISTRYPH